MAGAAKTEFGMEKNTEVVYGGNESSLNQSQIFFSRKIPGPAGNRGLDNWNTEGTLLKIAFIRDEFDPYGGAENFLRMLAKRLAETGAEVHLFARKWPEGGGKRRDTPSGSSARLSFVSSAPCFHQEGLAGGRQARVRHRPIPRADAGRGRFSRRGRRACPMAANPVGKRDLLEKSLYHDQPLPFSRASFRKSGCSNPPS